MPKIIAVLGATGSQGGSVARTFCKLPGWKVRGITRNPQTPAALELERLGIEVVRANLDDVNSLESAFRGVDAIYGVTDFWQFVQDPATEALVKSKNITWNEACYLQEVQQGKNIIDAAVRVVEHGNLERLVLSSLCDVRKLSRGKYTWAYHFESKAHFVQYLKEMAQKDSKYRSLYEKTSYVQIGSYLDNWKKNSISTPKKQPDGSFLFRFISASPSGKGHDTPFVYPPKDTGPFVEALVLTAPPCTTMLGTSSLMQFSEYVRIWGEIHGVKTAIKRVSPEEVCSMLPGGLGAEVAASACFAYEYGWDGGEGAILPEKLGVKSTDLNNVESYIRSTDWSSVLG